jgi:hypothetical protein
MNNKIALESLAMDLKRVALGYNRGSVVMAQRFYQEALERIKEVDTASIRPYLKTVLHQVGELQEDAENALRLSILIQNYTQTYL